MKRILLIVALVTFAASANAQFMINPVLGINTFVLSTDPPNASAGVSLGWSVGVNGRFGNHFIFEPGIHYLMQRNGVTVPNYDNGQAKADFIAKDNLSIIRIPLMFGLKLLGTEEHDQLFNINIHAGLSPSFLLAATNTNTNEDVKSAYNSVGLSVGGGIGLDILFLTLDVDLDYGLTDVYNSNNASSLPPALRTPIEGYHGKPFGVRVNLGFKHQFESKEEKKKKEGE